MSKKTTPEIAKARLEKAKARLAVAIENERRHAFFPIPSDPEWRRESKRLGRIWERASAAAAKARIAYSIAKGWA